MRRGYENFMRTKLFLFTTLFGILFSSNVNAQNIKQITRSRPADFEYLSSPDSLGVRHHLKMPKLTSKSSKAFQTKLPYPIIFIHGLDSDSKTWNETTNFMDLEFGLIYGGRFDFNLNDDNSNYTSNKLFYPTIGADISQWTTTLTNGDYYYLNFAVGSDGSFAPSNLSSLNVLSNEAAIAKQGVALSRVIQQVMDITGRDKVILMGHSMGGLCAREYLQNPENWTEPYVKHHVAKLITTGTPHGGYTGANFIFTGINSSSEAYRDLRTEYSNNNTGVFLYGGYENTPTIGSNFYNNDINCNGISNDNSTILGLNQKDLYNDVDYAYIMGNCTNCVITQGSILGDGVVRLVNANLGNFYNLPSPRNEFIYNASAITEIHSDLPKRTYENMQALDEPNSYDLAYGIDYGNIYTGFITIQSTLVNDIDNFTFNVDNTSEVKIDVNNIILDNLFAIIADSNGNVIGNINSSGGTGSISFTEILPFGKYYLIIYGTPATTSYLNPYSFMISGSSLTTNNLDKINSFLLTPNPTNSKIFFDNSVYNFDNVSVFNYLGQEVSKIEFTSFIKSQEVDLSILPNGVYVFKFENNKNYKSVKVVKQ